MVAEAMQNPPAMQETWVRPLGWEDSLEDGMATHSSILAWRTPRAEEPGRRQSVGLQRVGHDCVNNSFTSIASAHHVPSQLIRCAWSSAWRWVCASLLGNVP